MKRNTIIIAFVLGGIVILFFGWKNIDNGSNTKEALLQSENLPTPTAIPTPTPIQSGPTPTLIKIDQNSDLETESKKLVPDDFSNDFNLLKEEAKIF